MDEEELQQLLANSQGGIGARGWGGAAGARSSWNVPRSKYGRRDDITSEPASKQGKEWIDWASKLTNEQIIQKALDAGVYGSVPYLSMLNTLLGIKEELDPRIKEQFPNSTFENDPDPKGTGQHGGTDPTTEQERFNEIMKEFLERDRSPATEIPDYTPWEMPEYKPPPTPREEWASRYPDGRYRYPGDLDGYVKALISGIGATRNAGKIKYGYNAKGEMYALTDAEGNYLRNPIADYSKLRSSYPNALSLYARGKGIHKYVGEPGYENLLGLEVVEGDGRSWMTAQYGALEAQLQAEYQQELIDKQESYNTENELAKREHRSSYDEMVADMVETERLRQEEYAAEQQRYTDRYNESPDFYDNLFSGSDDKDFSENMDRHPPLINTDHPFFDLPIEDRGEVFGGMPINTDQPISQEEIILNQTRPGGGIGLSEQIINQAKPGAYLYPGMLN